MSYKCLLCCLQGGMFLFQLFDYYACNGACILFLCVFEVLAMGRLFGRYRDVSKEKKAFIIYNL